MIIVKLRGGLGNQMFQWAAATALANTHSVEAKVDIRELDLQSNDPDFAYRSYELLNFKNPPIIASDFELAAYEGTKSKGFKKLLEWIKGSNPVRYKEEQFSFDPDFFKLPNSTYLDGYFQSEKYFMNDRTGLLDLFQFHIEDTDINLKYVGDIQKQASISVHVRRGDYVKSKSTNEYHGVCSLEYYFQSIEYFKERIKDPVFYFFSDDIQWVKHKFNGSSSNFVFLGHNEGENSYKDMLLMSHCKHNIIANSSFSWWGAWLNRNPGKIVVAPDKWFNVSIDTSDLIPETWIKI